MQLQLQNRKFREALEFASDFIPPSMTQIDENGEIIDCDCPVCSALQDESTDIALKQHENKIIRAAVEYAFNATGINEGLSISDEEIEVWRKKLLDETN